MYTFQDMRTEEVQKGKSSYTKAVVVYSDPKYGQKEKTLLSFQNPAVFSALQKLKTGDAFSVKTEKNGQYVNWTAVLNGEDSGSTQAKPATAAVSQAKSTYETAEERAVKQVYIIKQSSLKEAVATLSVNPGKDKISPTEVIQLAQIYTDWVLGNDTQKVAEPTE